MNSIMRWLFGESDEFSFRPSLDWVPVANTDSPYKIAAYEAAAKNLNVRIKLAQPTPCAGIAMCGGMTGIWLHRNDSKKVSGDQFMSQMWKEYSRLTT